MREMFLNIKALLKGLNLFMKNSKKGYSLVVAVVLSAVLLIFVTSLIVIASFSMTVTASDITKNEAYINAKSALNMAESYYMQSANLPTTDEYFCITSSNGALDETSTSPVDIIGSETTAKTHETYVKASLDDATGTFTLTANSKYFNKGLTGENTTTLVCTYNVGYDSNYKISTAVRKVDTADPYRYVTVHVKPYPGGTGAEYENGVLKTPPDVLDPPYLYTWAYGEGQNEFPPDDNIGEARDSSLSTLLSYSWVVSSDANIAGPQCAMVYEGNGWYEYTITITDSEIDYFNAIVTEKGALRNGLDNNTENWHAQTTEMFNLPVPENAGETQDVYITLNNKDKNFNDKLNWELKDEESNSLTEFLTSYVEADYTTVHLRVTEDTGNTTTGQKLNGYSVTTNAIEDRNLLTSMEVAQGVAGDPYTGGALQYEGFGWYTIKIPTSSTFDLTLKNTSGTPVFSLTDLLGSSQDDLWIALDKNLSPTVKKTEDDANKVFTNWGDKSAGQYQTVNVKGLALVGGTPPDVQIKYEVTNDTSNVTPTPGEYSIILNYQNKVDSPDNKDTIIPYTRDNGDIFEFPNMSPREGYTFLGWNFDKDATDGEYKPWSDDENIKYYTVDPNDAVNKEIRFYAIWEEADYSVSYDSNGGGNAPSTQKVTTNKPITIANQGNMYKVGYNFLGWTDVENGKQAKDEFAPGKEISISSFTDSKTSIKLYAVWEKDDNLNVLSYNVNGGEGDPPQDVAVPKNGTEQEQTVTVPVSKVFKEGSDFLGWSYIDSNGDDIVILPDSEHNTIVVDRDIELKAVWAITTYPVTTIYLSTNLTIAPLVYAWIDGTEDKLFGGYDNNNNDEKRMTKVANEGSQTIWKIDIFEEYKDKKIGVIFNKNNNLDGDNNKIDTDDHYILNGENKIFYANSYNNNIDSQEVLTDAQIEEKFNSNTWTEVSSTQLNSNSFSSLPFDSYTVNELPVYTASVSYNFANSVKNIFTDILNIFNFDKAKTTDDLISEISTVSTLDVSNVSNMSISNNTQSSTVNIEKLATTDDETTQAQFPGNTYLYIDTSACNFVKTDDYKVAVEFIKDDNTFIPYTFATEIDKNIWRIQIPNADIKAFSIARQNDNGDRHNEKENISLDKYDSTGINCYKVGSDFNNGESTLNQTYNDISGAGKTPTTGNYGSMANRQGEKVQYYNIYMNERKDASGNYVNDSYNYYGFESKRAGNSDTTYYNEWYTYKIPTDDNSEYSLQFKNLAGEFNETVEIKSLTGDVYITLDTKTTDTNGKYDDLSIYTFDPDENYAQGTTKIYFENTEGWSNVYACVWGLEEKDWSKSVVLQEDDIAEKYYIEVPSSSPYIIFHGDITDENTPMQTPKISLTGVRDEVLYNANSGWDTYIHPEVAFDRAYNQAIAAMNIALFSDKLIPSVNTMDVIQNKVNDYKGKTYSTVADYENATDDLENYSSAVLAYADIIREARTYLKSSSYTEDDPYNNSTIEYTDDSIQELQSLHTTAMTYYDNASVTVSQLNSIVVKIRRAIDYGLQPKLTDSSSSTGSALTPTADQAIIVLQDYANWAPVDSMMNEVSGMIYEETSGGIKNVIKKNEQMEYINAQGYYLYYIDFTGSRNKADFGFTPQGMSSNPSFNVNTLTGIKPGEIWIYNNQTDEWRLNNDEGLQVVSSSIISGTVGDTTGYWIKPRAGENRLTVYFSNDTTVKYGSSQYVIFAGTYQIPMNEFTNGGINLLSQHAKEFFTNPANYGMTTAGTTANVTDILIGAKKGTDTGTATNNDNTVTSEADFNAVGHNSEFTNTTNGFNVSSSSSAPYTYTANAINFRWAQGDNGDPLFIKGNYIVLDSSDITFASTDYVVNLDATGNATGSLKLGANSSSSTYDNKIIFKTDVNVLVYNHDGTLNKDRSFVIYNGKYETQTQVDILDFKDELAKANGKVKNVDKSVLSGGVFS